MTLIFELNQIIRDINSRFKKKLHHAKLTRLPCDFIVVIHTILLSNEILWSACWSISNSVRPDLINILGVDGEFIECYIQGGITRESDCLRKAPMRLVILEFEAPD